MENNFKENSQKFLKYMILKNGHGLVSPQFSKLLFEVAELSENIFSPDEKGRVLETFDVLQCVYTMLAIEELFRGKEVIEKWLQEWQKKIDGYFAKGGKYHTEDSRWLCDRQR